VAGGSVIGRAFTLVCPESSGNLLTPVGVEVGHMPEDDIEGRIRAFWDRDSDTYDRSPSHGASDAVEAAVWRAVLWRHLPPVDPEAFRADVDGLLDSSL